MAAENLDDVQSYVRLWLAEANLSVTSRETLLANVVAASQGNFLYLSMLRDAVTNGTLSLNAPEGLPQGLIGLYERWFWRWFSDREAYKSKYRPVLEVIAASEHPVPEIWLSRIFGWSKIDAQETLEAIGSLFERRPDGVAPFHKSLRDWLIDPQKAGATFAIDEKAGKRRLLRALWDSFRRWTDNANTEMLDSFCVVELPIQLIECEEIDVDSLNLQPWDTVQAALFRIASLRATAFEWESALVWWRTTARLVRVADKNGNAAEAYASIKAGDILIVLGRVDRALELFRDGLAMFERLVKLDPDNVALKHDLSVSLDRLGDVLFAHRHLPDALKRYHEALDIRQLLLQMQPDDTHSQRNLSVSYERIGDVLFDQGALDDALKSFNNEIAIRERLTKAAPNNRDWQHDLSIAYERIGKLFFKQSRLEAALKSFNDSLAIRSTLTAADPSNFVWQHALSVCYDRIGRILIDLGNLDEALARLNDSLKIVQRLASIDSSNAILQRDVALAHFSIGDVLVAQNKFDDALAAFKTAQVILRSLYSRDPRNADCTSNLSACYERFGNVLKHKGLYHEFFGGLS